MTGDVNVTKRNHRITSGITTVTHFENGFAVFAPFDLPQNNWSFYVGKTNDVTRCAKRFLFGI
jgi:hypothetical protein